MSVPSPHKLNNITAIFRARPSTASATLASAVHSFSGRQQPALRIRGGSLPQFIPYMIVTYQFAKAKNLLMVDVPDRSLFNFLTNNKSIKYVSLFYMRANN